jgi:aminoglycoside phosphotransferase (APT) family kinase protein
MNTTDEEARLAAWVENELNGRVTRLTRLPRWRPAWDIDVEVKGRVLPLHARGERERTILMPFRIADEVPVHHLLEAHGLPVPHAYGLCDDPYALVMDRLAGHVDLSFAADDAERDRLVGECLELLARVYEIPVSAAAAAGFEMPADDAATALGYFRKIEADYDPLMQGAPVDPIALFLRRWLAGNVPPGRHAAARFILYDAFQFMFADGRITGLLDFEMAHIADPMMDLAALRIRDTIKSIGDLATIASRYEAATGVPVDHDVVEYHSVLYNVLSVIPTGPSLAAPTRAVDWLSYLAWYTNGARWAFECIAEMRGFELEPVALPEPRLTRRSPAYRHLVESLRSAASGATAPDYELVSAGKLANHLRRVDEVGPALDAADLDDLARALGYRPDTAEADAELVDLVLHAGADREEELVRLLDARAQRMHVTLASPTSLMVRHPRLRSLRPDRSSVRGADDTWPAGAIPGTA